MSVVTQERRRLLETPYRREAEQRATELAQRAVMPKSVDGLVAWYANECSYEVPVDIHTAQVWRDYVQPHEAENGIKPVGSSESGALAYADAFRRRLENSPSEIDEDGYYRRPISSALSRLGRGKPLMARHLLMLATAGFDWRKRADAIGWAHEEYEVYIAESLRRLWFTFREQKRLD